MLSKLKKKELETIFNNKKKRTLRDLLEVLFSSSHEATKCLHLFTSGHSQTSLENPDPLPPSVMILKWTATKYLNLFKKN